VLIELDLIPGYRVHHGGVRTGEVAAQARVNTQTLRYYERRGLLPEPERTRSGYRAYTPDAVRVVRFVKRAQQLGFTLDDVEDLLHLAEGGPASCDDARTMARTRIVDLQWRIDELAGMRDALGRLVDTCDQPRAERDCPILRDIESAATTTSTQE
jgi:DNA-binding transcriptional MerR regulator